jgi:hypothetical protein
MSDPGSAGRWLRGVHPWSVIALLVCGFGLWLRILNAHTSLSSPSIDENDVVEQAVAFMGGEWKYYLFEYGALPMYLLAAAYHVVAVLRGLTPFDYATRVFFDGGEMYLIARLSCAVCYAILAFVCYRWAAPRFGRIAGVTSATLLALPVLDALTNGTVRIDVMQGAFQLGAVLALTLALESRAWRHWLLAGACAGFAVASKPMPGLLVAPCFLVASWFAAAESPAGALGLGLPSRGRALARRLLRTVSQPGLWLAGLAAVVAAGLGNPTMLELGNFIQGQRDAMTFYSGPKAPGGQRNVFETLPTLGTPFLIAAGLSLSAMPFVRDARARLVALFPLFYATAFWGRPMRNYYLVAPAMALCLVIGIGIGLLLCRLGWDAPAGSGRETVGDAAGASRARRWNWLGLGLALAFVAYVAYPVSTKLDLARRTPPNVTLAREWIYQNVPVSTGVFQYGRAAGGPGLVGMDWKQTMKASAFFQYGRERYDFYQRAFRKAYQDYVEQGRPRYAIEIHPVPPVPVKNANNPPGWLARGLARRAAEKNQEYIILGGFRGTEDVAALGYSWLSSVKLAAQFGHVVIFQVPKPSATPPAAASAPASDG